MKLVLGTAQLGMNYGIMGSKKIICSEFLKIQKTAIDSKIKYIDTAIDYGDSEKILGKSKLKNLKIITKIKISNKIKSSDLESFIFNQIKLSMKKLNVNMLYGLLIHDFKNLKNKRQHLIVRSLEKLKQQKKINKIGISLYETSEIKKILKSWTPDIIQIPINVLDQRWLSGNLISRLKKKKIQIFSRSCFLQGLLVSDIKNKKVPKKLNELIYKFKKWCEKKKISRLEACIHFIKNVSGVDFVVIGINSNNHLNEIIKVFKKKKKNFLIRNFSTPKKKIIDPRYWN